MPLEIMHLPLWFPFHLSKVSYWSRTVIVPLLVLMALRPRGAQSARRRDPGAVPHAARAGARLDPRPVSLRAGGGSSKRLDIGAARRRSRRFPRRSRQRAIDKAVRFVTERLNGDDGLGGIYPAIANSVMMFDTLGYPPDHPDCRDRLARGAQAAGGGAGPRLLPALPVAGLGHRPGRPCDGRGGRRHDRCRLRLAARAADHWTWSATGRCAGQDCGPAAGRSSTPIRITPMWTTPPWSACCCIATAIPAYAEAIERAREWIIGMQSSDGGWGAFEPENTHLYLNHIPFADHGALLDPPTADVTARCVSFLAQIGMPADDPVMARALGVSAARAGGGRKLVRPLGHQLHLRHMVGAVRAQRRRHRAGRSGGAARGGVAGVGAAR